MKVIVEKASRITKYVVPDDRLIVANETSVSLADLVICDLNQDTIEIVENVEIPEDWETNKYCYRDGFVSFSRYDFLQLKKALYAELETLRTEMAGIVYQCKLNYDVEPEGLIRLIPYIRAMYGFAKSEIEALTVENVRDYVLRSPKYEQVLSMLKTFL
jgi:hypothetical protein